MTGTKKFYKSRGVMGGLLAALGGGVGFLGYQVTGEDISAAVGHLDSIAVAVGGLLAIVGRIKASQSIG